MDLLIEIIKISKVFKAKKLSGTEFTAFEENCVPDSRRGRILYKDSYCLFTSIFAFFACYPPEFFKIICLTYIWLKFVDSGLHSSQKPPQISATSDRHIFKFFKNRCVKLNTRWGLELGT